LIAMKSIRRYYETMNIVDNVEITIKAGDGGNGAITFRREIFVPFGGPDGGDGGKGGNVYIRTDENLTDLGLFKRKTLFKAEAGGHGRRQKMHGKNGEDLVIHVPPGTIITFIEDDGRKTVIADLKQRGQKVLAAAGGKGGKGNVHFATSTNQAPKKATPGKPGEMKRLLLDLKIIADVGIIGYPSAGKSTLLRAISRANPEVAPYPFTTREPVLGVVNVGHDTFLIAEIPGLIEGAHKGRGLGHKFLRHAERTGGFLFLLDGTSPDVATDLRNLNNELVQYKSSFGQKQRIIAVNKIDIPEVFEKIPRIRKSLEVLSDTVFFVSAQTGTGISELIPALQNLARQASDETAAIEPPPVIFRPKPKYSKNSDE